MTLRDLGEKRLVREVLKPLLPAVVDGVGAGDDAAVVPFPAGARLVASSDKIPEDLLAVEFGLMSPTEQGRYLVAVSVSDIAAMGASPLGTLLTLALTDDYLVEDLRELVAGAVAAGREWGAPVLGGDTGSGSAVCMSSSSFGYITGDRTLTRSDAVPGDLIAVSGPLGGFGAALAYFAARIDGTAPKLSPEVSEGLRRCLVYPTPRVDLAPRLISGDWCHACMDITDGLGQSLRELSEASDIGFQISAESIPINPLALTVSDALNLDLYELVFGIGLDLELLVTIGSDGVDDARDCGVMAFGEVQVEKKIVIERNGTKTGVPGRGWEHFGGNVREYLSHRR